MKIIHKEKITGTASSGTFSSNTKRAVQGLLRNIVVKPTTSTTQYDVKLLDGDSLTIWERTSEVGEFTDQVALPFRGVYTLTVSNSTVDEAFTIGLMIEE